MKKIATDYTEHSLFSQFLSFYSIVKNAAQAFHMLLEVSPEVSKKELWETFTALIKEGFSEDALINAIICSKVLDETDMIVLLKIRKFKYEECWTTLRYYRSEDFFLKLLRSIQKSGYTREYEKILFMGGNDDVPLYKILTSMPLPEKDIRFSEITMN